MRASIAQAVAPMQPSRTYSLKGAWQFSAPEISNTFDGFMLPASNTYAVGDRLAFPRTEASTNLFERTVVTADYVRPLRGASSEPCEFGIDHPSVVDVALLIDSSLRPRIVTNVGSPEIQCESVDIAGSIVSEDQVRSGACNEFPPPEIRECVLAQIPIPDFFDPSVFVLPAVSKNLLTPIGIPERMGKRYTEDPHEENSVHDIFETKGMLSTGSHAFRKAYRQKTDRTGVTRKTLTIWDMLLPVLKRPLQLDGLLLLDLPSRLFPFQITGVQSLVENKAYLLADEMGTGKTVMTAVAIRILFQKGIAQRALILCPKSVLSVWDNHLRDWARILSATVVSGPQQLRQVDWKCPAHVYVTTYDLLRGDTEGHGAPLKDLKFDIVVLDEAQAIKNSSSKRSQAVRKLEAKFRWALTGTPVQNKVDDLVSLFRFVKPEVFGPSHLPPAPDDARRRIKPFFLRRRKTDVFPELPRKLRTDEWFDLAGEQRAEYDAVLSKGRRDFEGGDTPLTKIHIFALLNRLKQICNFASDRKESPKSEALQEQVEEIVDGGHKVLVFTQYLEQGLKKLKPLLEHFGLVALTGNMSDFQRKDAIRQFQSDPKTRVFLATIKTGGEGITLTAASYVVHFDHWWNPAVAWQAEDRAHRKGQTETVNVYSYWMRDTVEERILAILQRKGLLHAEIIDSLSDEDFEKSMTLEDFCSALGLKIDIDKLRR